MSSVELYVGIDYHSRSVHVHASDGQGKRVVSRKVASNAFAVADLLRGRGRVVRVLMESCCGSAIFADELAEATGWDIVLGQAAEINRKGGLKEKTDRQDAAAMAELCRLNAVSAVWVPPAWIRDLRATVNQRASVVNARRGVKCRILGMLRELRIDRPEGTAWTLSWLEKLSRLEMSPCRRGNLDALQRQLAFHECEIKHLETRLEQMLENDPIYRSLLNQRQIGPVTAAVFRAFIGEFGRFRSAKSLSRYCGVSPRNASSGERQATAGLVRRAEPVLKTMVIELAHRLRNKEPRWKALGKKLRERGKPTNVVIGAIANRFMRGLYHDMLLVETWVTSDLGTENMKDAASGPAGQAESAAARAA